MLYVLGERYVDSFSWAVHRQKGRCHAFKSTGKYDNIHITYIRPHMYHKASFLTSHVAWKCTQQRKNTTSRSRWWNNPFIFFVVDTYLSKPHRSITAQTANTEIWTPSKSNPNWKRLLLPRPAAVACVTAVRRHRHYYPDQIIVHNV